MRLGGKVAWVTGAGNGIGEAAALSLAREGARVVLTGRRREPLEAVASRIRGDGGQADVQPADLTQAASVEGVGAFLHQGDGRLDILVNNAGLNIPDRHWDVLTPTGAEEVIRANLSSAFFCVTVALPLMRARKDGVLIHTASFAGRFVGGVGGPAYNRGQARRGGDEPLHQHGGMREPASARAWFALARSQPPILDKRPRPGDRGGARPHGAAGGLRRPDPVCGVPAAACLHQRGADQPDLEPRLRRRPGTARLGRTETIRSPRRDQAASNKKGETHARRSLPWRVRRRDHVVPGPDPRPGRGRAGDEGVRHVRQRPAPVSPHEGRWPGRDGACRSTPSRSSSATSPPG